MSNVYIEARPRGFPEGSPVIDYVVEDRANLVLAAHSTRADAIEWAKQNGYTPLVPWVRHINDRAKPDQWRVV
jgi:hypothetical protein